MTILSREQVASHLSVPTSLLVRYEARGLVRVARDERGIEGYEPAEIRRVWSVVSLHRDLGINLAGIEAILKLRAQIDDVHARLQEITDRLRDALEAEA